MKNTIFQRLLIGIKLGIKLSLLPESVSKFHNYPLTRIFRVLGGISIISLLSGSLLVKESFLFYIVVFLAIFHFMYIIVINLIKFFYIIYLWLNKKLQVRNSPLDRLASFSLSLVACIKGTCEIGLYGGGALALGLSIDELLLNYGR